MGVVSSKTNTNKANKPLFDAIASNNLDRLNDLLKIKHLDVNTSDKKNRTALHLVKTAPMAEMLINAGADVMALDEEGKTPLHYADNEEIARTLINSGADVMARDNQGKTPLHHPHNERIASVLIHSGANVKATDEKAYTPLHYAESPEIVEILVANGADLQARSDDSYGGLQHTPLTSAVHFGRARAALSIIDYLPLEQLNEKPEFNNGLYSKYWDDVKQKKEESHIAQLAESKKVGSETHLSREVDASSVLAKAAPVRTKKEIDKTTRHQVTFSISQNEASTSASNVQQHSDKLSSRLSKSSLFSEIKEKEETSEEKKAKRSVMLRQ